MELRYLFPQATKDFQSKNVLRAETKYRVLLVKHVLKVNYKWELRTPKYLRQFLE